MCPVAPLADFLGDVGGDRNAAPGQNPRRWQQGYVGQASQRKTSNCDVPAKDRFHHGREAEGAQSSFYNTERSVAASVRG